jgi:hypothetical protein
MITKAVCETEDVVSDPPNELGPSAGPPLTKQRYEASGELVDPHCSWSKISLIQKTAVTSSFLAPVAKNVEDAKSICELHLAYCDLLSDQAFLQVANERLHGLRVLDLQACSLLTAVGEFCSTALHRVWLLIHTAP